MKQVLICALFTVVSIFGFGQSASGISMDYPQVVDFHEPAAVQHLTDKILGVIGLQPEFTLKASGKVSNIEAVISRRKRYILYNPEFMGWIQNATKNDWAIIALLAHEIGHHLNGHTLGKTGSNPKTELEADEFAGFVLNKMGASLEQAQVVMKYISNTEGSKTHPARADRMLAIQNGWNKAKTALPTDAGG